MEIKNNGLLTIENLKDSIESVRYSPTAITRAILEHVETVTDGQVNLLDMTSPAMMLLSAGAVMTSAAIDEITGAHRAIYPTLATTAKDLYRHMTDKEFINIFAVPGSTTFTVIMSRDDVLRKMIYDPEEKAYKAIFPRDSLFKALETPFTLEYPIVIRLADNGTFEISYDTSIPSPVAKLKTNVIKYRSSSTLLNDVESAWIAFDIEVRQFDIKSVTYPLERSIPLKKVTDFPDKYYMSRVFYRNAGSDWIEIKVTHGDYVYDTQEPTALLDVIENTIEISLPQVYINNGLISGELRHDIYFTKGEISERYSNLGLDSFSLTRRAIDEERDVSVYTNALSDINHSVYAPGIATGGRNPLTLEKIRSRVINHTTGSISLPITPVQFASAVEDAGFDLVRNTDTVTNRIYLATRKLPKPTSSKLVSPANIGMNTFIPDLEVLSRSPYVKNNGLRKTITDKALYINENGIVRMLTRSETEALKSMNRLDLLTEVNSEQYLFSPYHYVLDDTDSRFDVRCYDLSAPELKDLNFKEQNQSMRMTVSTQAFNLEKIEIGYRLTFSTRSGTFYKNADSLGMTQCQIGFYPVGENKMAHINCTKVGTTPDDETIWSCDLETNLEIDSRHCIRITNASVSTASEIDVWINLESTIHVFHCSNSVSVEYKPSHSDLLINTSMLPQNSKALTHEELTLKLGVALNALWKRGRILPTGKEYLRYEDNIPDRYETDIYEINPATGTEIFIEGGVPVRRKLHSAGDIREDQFGNKIYKHRAGDFITDADGNPILSGQETSNRELDMLFIDGRYYFVTDDACVEYVSELIQVLTTWITENIQELSEVALENTKVYFYPKTTLGNVKVNTEDNGTDVLPSEQTLKVELYVNERVYKDNELRETLINKTVVVLDEEISKTVVNITEIERALTEAYMGAVVSLKVSGLGGDKNYRVLSLAAEENRMCLKKILKLQQDNSLIIGEDVDVKFYQVRG